MERGWQVAEQKAEAGRRGQAGEMARSTVEDWAEESNRQAARLEQTGLVSDGAYGEFRRKLARGGGTVAFGSKASRSCAVFGRLTLTFHQGRPTKAVLGKLTTEGQM